MLALLTTVLCEGQPLFLLLGRYKADKAHDDFFGPGVSVCTSIGKEAEDMNGAISEIPPEVLPVRVGGV